MWKLCAVGEALIDFVPVKKGFHLKDVTGFERVAGGAPANVAGAFAKLCGESRLLTKLGDDAFGDHIVEKLMDTGVDCSYIKQSRDYETSLAFVSLAADGNRDFAFYRRNAADLHLREEDVAGALEDMDILHFCSVSLVESETKETHIRLLQEAKAKGMLISFDPNVRLSLWPDAQSLKDTIHAFIPYANILKISDDELEFITGTADLEEAVPQLFQNPALQALVYTKGKAGASVYTRTAYADHAGFEADVQDTTGAGDAFIAAFLWYLSLREEKPETMDEESLWKGLLFANAYGALATQKKGALDAFASQDEMALFIEKHMDTDPE